MNPEYLERNGHLPGRQLLEDQILGCIMQNPIWLQACDLTVEDFTGFNREIFSAIVTLNEEGRQFDAVDVYQRIGNGFKVNEKLTTICTSHGFPGYLADLKKKILEEFKVKHSRLMAEKIKAGEDPTIAADELSRQVIGEMERLGGTEKDEEFSDVVQRILREIKTGILDASIKTGVCWFDKTTKGLAPGEMTIIAARPSNGKTALVLQLLIGLARQGVRSVFFSKEMTSEMIAIRLLQHCSRANAGLLYRGKKDESIRNDVLSISPEALEIAGNIHVISRNITSTAMIEKETKKAIGNGARVMALDYLQLLNCKAQSREQEVSRISSDLKNMLKDCQIPGLILSQITRGVEHDNRKPRLSDLRESGSLEQDADNVCFLHQNVDKANVTKNTEFLMEKGRNVGRGYNLLTFCGISQMFSEIERSDF